MPVLSGDPYLQTVRTQIGIDKISGQILIQLKLVLSLSPSILCVCEQRKLWWNFTNAQADWIRGYKVACTDR